MLRSRPERLAGAWLGAWVGVGAYWLHRTFVNIAKAGHFTPPRGEGDADFKIFGPATQKNYGNATAAPAEPGRNFGPAFGEAQYTKQFP